MNVGMTWPDFFPADCPPSDAEDASGRLYRLIAGEDPEAGDFVPLVVSQPGRTFAERQCQACGLSVYREVDDAHRLRRRVPGHRDKRIAVGEFDEEPVGRLRHTPTRHEDSHHTWWVPESVEPSGYFTRVDEPTE